MIIIGFAMHKKANFASLKKIHINYIYLIYKFFA
jgi:hypothetical protein